LFGAKFVEELKKTINILVNGGCQSSI